jgi:hypothetical protein
LFNYSYSQDSAYIYFKKKYVKMPFVSEVIWEDSSSICRLIKISNSSFLYAAYVKNDTTVITCGILKLVYVDSLNYLIRDKQWLIMNELRKFDFEFFHFSHEDEFFQEEGGRIFTREKKKSFKGKLRNTVHKIH